jgi:hypothetical protein
LLSLLLLLLLYLLLHLCLSLLLWLLPLAVSLAAAVDCSSSRFDFFPQDRLNIPGGWNKANQTKAGNDCNGHLLPIAVQGIPKPLLHFLPVHELLEAGAEVPAEHVPNETELEAIIQAALAEQQLRQHEALKAQLLQQQQQQQAAAAGALQDSTQQQALRKLQQADGISKTETISIRRAAGVKLQELLRLPKLPAVQLFGRSTSPAAAPVKQSSRMRQAKATKATSKQQLAADVSDASPAVDDQQTVAVPKAPAASAKPAAVAAAEDSWKVTVPAEYEFTVNVNGKLWFKSKTFKGGSGIPEVNFNANVTEGRRDVFDPTIFQEVSCGFCQSTSSSSRSSSGSSSVKQH